MIFRPTDIGLASVLSCYRNNIAIRPLRPGFLVRVSSEITSDRHVSHFTKKCDAFHAIYALNRF